MISKPRKSVIPVDMMAAPAPTHDVTRGTELPSVPPSLPKGKDGKGIKGSTVGTTVYLLPEEAKRLRILAAQTDRSLHDIILDGLDRVLAEHRQPPLKRYSGR